MRNMIGNSPLLYIKYKYKGEERKLYAKAEYFSLTGSIKDRMASHIINKSYETGILQKGQPIVEATSGNTGIAFSALGALLGHEVHIFMPDWMSKERKDMIQNYGAILHEVSKEEGGFIGSIKMADAYAKEINGFRPQQFSNHFNSNAHYETTAPEIISQLRKLGTTPEMFVAGVGTGGTVMGVGKRIKEEFENALVFPLEPSNSPTMTTGCKIGKHRIQGISDEFVPDIIDLDFLDEIIQVDDGDSVIMTQMLASKLGLGVGISSGANFLGSVIAQNKYGSDKTVVTIFSDDSKKYLSTDLLSKEPIKNHFLSKDIELISVDGICICNKRIYDDIC